MLPEISKIKGIHPGAILKREVKLRGLKSNELADSINEYSQTISAILNERRGINPGLSIKLGKEFGIDEDYFMILQASYEVKRASKIHKTKKPNLNNIRKVLFWDTDFKKIDWKKDRKAIIKRVFERGNDIEINEFIKFYGKAIIKKELQDTSNDFLPSFNRNLSKYNIKEVSH